MTCPHVPRYHCPTCTNIWPAPPVPSYDLPHLYQAMDIPTCTNIWPAPPVPSYDLPPISSYGLPHLYQYMTSPNFTKLWPPPPIPSYGLPHLYQAVHSLHVPRYDSPHLNQTMTSPTCTTLMRPFFPVLHESHFRWHKLCMCSVSKHYLATNVTKICPRRVTKIQIFVFHTHFSSPVNICLMQYMPPIHWTKCSMCFQENLESLLYMT